MFGTRTSATPAGALTGAGGAETLGTAAAADVATPSASSVRMRLPSDTLSPSLTWSALTTPAAGAGTSIVALSDSSVINGSSALTRSSGLTMTSMTGTSLKSPISGTLTSIVLIATSEGVHHRDTEKPIDQCNLSVSVVQILVFVVYDVGVTPSTAPASPDRCHTS